MKAETKKRFACLTKEQQHLYNTWTPRQRAYAVFRAQGYDKANAYRAAGYKCDKQAGQNAYKMEKITVGMKEIISAMMGERQKIDVLLKNSPTSKAIDEKAGKEILNPIDTAFLSKVDENSPIIREVPKIDVGDLTVEQCKNIKFFRSIADGTIKSIREIKEYDAEGKLLKRRVEETSDIDTRIKAQKEVMRIVGINDVIELGRVEANNINIMIVDASKREELSDSRNKVEIPLENLKEVDGQMAIVEEVEVRPNGDQ